ncbi:DUF4407 domain-containing protein [Amycolatopsis kentuckyensis]|uniref:DUF4407 domain-containing protein n=1 Tax=Amycolatopsis kentuckyensis TaxID=218823 RepID=UPI00356B4ED1
MTINDPEGRSGTWLDARSLMDQAAQEDVAELGEHGTYRPTLADDAERAYEHFKIGVWYFERGDPKEALRWLRTAVEQDIVEAEPLLQICLQELEAVSASRAAHRDETAAERQFISDDEGRSPDSSGLTSASDGRSANRRRPRSAIRRYGALARARWAATTRRFGDALVWIGGADRVILQAAPTNRASFVQMGLVVLGTAGLGIVSMSFALHNGMQLSVPLAVSGGLLWGFLIAVIDRFLIMNVKLRNGFRKAVAVVGVRMTIAALLGIVISTPLVLQIFQDEIAKQVVRDNLSQAARDGKLAEETPSAKELKEVRTKIAIDENTLRGLLPAVTFPEVEIQQDYLDKARQSYESARGLAESKYRSWQCELYGSSCEGSTHVAGNGNLAKAREGEYRAAQRRADSASTAVAEAEAALTEARQAAATQARDAFRQAQDAAIAELPVLRQRANQLQAEVNGNVDSVDKTNADDGGLLAQIVALGHLNDNSSAALAHYMVAGLFFMIELLPVLVRIVTSAGPPSAYERIRDAAEDAEVEKAKIEKRREVRDRDEAERRAAAATEIAAAVADDMRSRERDLGIEANKRLAIEMKKILDGSLTQWAKDVRRTLQAAAGPGTTGVEDADSADGGPAATGSRAGLVGAPSTAEP